MVYLMMEPQHAEAFQTRMQDEAWSLILQDGGQSQFIGWAYMMKWEKTLAEGGRAEVTLHYSDNQGILECYLEMNPLAKPLMDALVASL
ncbi:MAG: hypothetical protein ACP5D0_07945 [Hydrogenovibrio sp.]